MSTSNADRHQPDRLANLEALFMHLERQVAELNQIVLEQGRMLERLQRELRRQREAAEVKDELADEKENGEWP
jgi:uncharacterized coiled-coil protein SlyX